MMQVVLFYLVIAELGVCIKSWNWATRNKTIRHGLYLDGKFVLGVWDWDLNVSYHERLSKARGLRISHLLLMKLSGILLR